MRKQTSSLSLHKSNIERSRRKQMKARMEREAKEINDNGDIVAYAIVALSDDGRGFASWDTGGVIPMWAMPSIVKDMLAADIWGSDVDEDFKKPLIDRAWKGAR